MKFRNKAIFSLAILILATVTSCKVTEEVEEQTVDEGKEILNTSTFIEAGNLFGSGEEGITEGGHVFNSWDEAKAFTVKMNKFNKGFKGFSVDMEEKTVITYFDQVRPTLSYAVKFVSMMEYSGKIEVKYQLVSPTGPAAEVITQPYVMVCIPKTNKEISFSLTE